MNLKLPKARFFKKSASFMKRMGAFIVDLIILNFIVFSSFNKIVLKFVDPNVSLTDMLSSLQSIDVSGIYTMIFFMSFLSLLYFVSFELKLSQTPGMMLLKIKVNGDITFWKSVFRNIFVFPFFPFNILWVIEPIYLVFKGLRFTEKLTSTNTIEEISF